MSPITPLKLSLAACSALLLASCAGPPEEDEPAALAQSEAALHGHRGSALYFRCDATGWNLDQATRMEEVAGTPGVYQLTYQVTATSMTIDGDRCVVTRTEAQGGCDGRHHHHGHRLQQKDYRSTTSPVLVPGGGSLTRAQHHLRRFRIIYPSLGTYVMTVDWSQRTFTLAEKPGAPVALQPLLDLRVGASDASAHVIVQEAAPAAGPMVLHLPPVTDAIAVSADGTTLAFQPVVDPTSPDTLIQLDVPAGTQGLRVEYDQLDATLPYEGSWYLEVPPVSGPRHVAIHLPADAVVDRSNHTDDDPAPSELAYDLAPGETLAPFVAYATAATPDLYDHLATARFDVGLPIAHRRYQPAVLGLLENLDALFRSYTGQDVRQIQGGNRYTFEYPPGGWKWGGVTELAGGLSVNGFSTVNARLVPGITLPTPSAPNVMVAVTAHELGNGWWGAWEEPDLTNHTPTWINNEGHSSFLRSEGELDLGYCADAQLEYAGKYQLFQTCAPDLCPGENTVVLLTSLRSHYGWGPLQAFYAAVQDRSTFQLRNLTDVERASVVIDFFSRQVGEDLGPFFDAFQIPFTQQVRDEMATRPAATVPIIDPAHLACRPPSLRVANVPLEAWIPAGAVVDVSDYVCAPGGFTATLSPAPGFTLRPTPPTDNCGVVTIAVDPSQLGAGPPATLTLAANGLPDPPVVVPINLTVVFNQAADPGFDLPLGAPWSEVAFISSPGLFALDPTVLRDGVSSGASARIDSPIDNDARLVQTVSVLPGTRYRLTAWVRTEGVEGGQGANLTVEWPGAGWANSRGVQGTNDWQQVTLEVSSGTATSFEVQVRLGQYGATSHGRAWFDDLELFALGPG